MFEFLRGWFGDAVPGREHRAVLQGAADLTRANKKLKEENESIKANVAELEAALASANDENARLKSRIAEAVELLQS